MRVAEVFGRDPDEVLGWDERKQDLCVLYVDARDQIEAKRGV